MRDVCIIRYGPTLPIAKPSMQNVYPPTQNIYFTLKVSRSTTQKGTLFGNSIDPYTLFRGFRKLRTQVLFLRVWGRLSGLGHLRVCGSATVSLLFAQSSMRYRPKRVEKEEEEEAKQGVMKRRGKMERGRKHTSAQQSHTGNQTQKPSS